jgi:hypothetical protein
MAKVVAAKRSLSGGRRRGAGSRAGWVRKNVIMDQRKLDAARRALGVDTETEAIDRALDTNIFVDGFRSEEAQAEVFAFLSRARRVAAACPESLAAQ